VPLPPPPDRTFASDNAAGAHPRVIEAIAAANAGHALAYGADPWTARVEGLFRDLFGPDAETFLVWGGTGANVMALASLLGPAEAVVCSDVAHINVDETGAPERVLGAKLMDLPTADGMLSAAQLEELAHLLGNEHHAQPGVLSLTQPTELGTLYTPEQIAALCDTAHRLGMRVHLDGARIPNAVAALGGDVDALRAFTVDAGVDVVSFGLTKGGLAYGEAVVYLDPSLARRARYVRKQVTQLPSKMRFIAAQFEALLTDGLWIELGRHANAMAAKLYDQVQPLPHVHLDAPPAVNSIFPVLDPTAIRALQEWSFFWDWDVSRHQVRWMTAWDTTDVDLDRFVAGIRQVGHELTAG
jgi:threonine aldolase